MRDYYQDLGLGDNATEAQIKSAYRKLAKEHHPDRKGGNPEKFKEISEAYSVLSDQEKRRQYDQVRRYGGDFSHFQQGAPSGSGFAEGIDLEDLFGSFFGDFQGAPRRSRSQRGQNMQMEVAIPFTTSILGGEVSVSRPSGGRLSVKIPPGVKPNQQLRLKGEGGQGIQGGPSGDLLVKVVVAAHPTFRRENDHVLSEVPVDYLDMILGATLEVETVHGPVELTIPAGMSSESRLRVKGYGVRRVSSSGDHYVILKPVFPKTLTDKQRDLLTELRKLRDS